MRLHSLFSARLLVPVLALAALLVACTPAGGAPSGCCTQPPSPATQGPPRTVGELRVGLIEQVGEPWFCDPDEYPIAREERQRALERFAEVQADRDDYVAAAASLGIDAAGELTDDEKVAIYHLWKRMLVIELTPSGDRYAFEYLVAPQADQSHGRLTSGTIDAHGAVDVTSEVPAGAPNCPICLARGTRIATPTGDVPVEDIGVGDAVWSFDSAGGLVAATVLAVGSTPVPDDHEVVALRLADGRELGASPGHPLSDGRVLGTIDVGDLVDGSAVVHVELAPYGDDRTFDLVATGPTGGYLANGIPLLSTLR